VGKAGEKIIGDVIMSPTPHNGMEKQK